MITYVLSLFFILLCSGLAWTGHPVLATLLGAVYSLTFITMARRIKRQNANVPDQLKYLCTDCRADAYVGLSEWTDKSGKVMIGKDERLCVACAKKRNVQMLT